LSPELAELLEGAAFRDVDIVFDREYVLYLGGVTVRMIHVGPAHTTGDTVFLVEGENVLFAGDVAMQSFPGIRTGDYSIVSWRKALATIAALDPGIVVPSHGPTGGPELISAYAGLFATLQARATELKASGLSADEFAGQMMQALEPGYPDWNPDGLARLGNAARVAYAEAP
jgi:glyoxylase-like metal-dependent hydrolase (beta-lactamase superfamily II)